MSLWSKLFGVDEENAARAAEADRKLAELNRQALERGHWTQAQYEQAEANRLGGFSYNPDDYVLEGFKEGWAEGRENLTNTIKSGLNEVGKTAGAVLLGIPLWLWLLLAVGLWLWLGAPGATRLKGALK